MLELDHSLEEKEVYSNLREDQINNLRRMAGQSPADLQERYLINNMFYERYYAYVCDSAIYYLNQNLDIAEQAERQDWAIQTNLRMAYIMVTSGMYFEAEEIIRNIDRNTVRGDNLAEYYRVYMKLYSELGFNTLNNKISARYYRTSRIYQDSLKQVLDPGSYKSLIIEESRYLDKRDFENALRISDIRLKEINFGTPEYALAAFERSLIYELTGDAEMRLEWLILSAISDIRSATKDNASLCLVAGILFDNGDLDRSVRYIRASMDDALFYNTKLRYNQISATQPIIDKAYQIKTQRQKSNLILLLVSILLLSLLLLVALLFIRKQLFRLRKSEKKLQYAIKQMNDANQGLRAANERRELMNRDIMNANHIKEKYIGAFMGLCSDYIDKLEKYSRMVYRKVSDGQYKELANIAKSTEFIEYELEEFYKNFDAIFLNIYPDFVSEFNDLLEPENKIILKKDELLNSELRIFALIRLGIEDSAEIARLLRYSINTIYSYRAKVKAKAKASVRKDFEEQVKEIGSFHFVK